MTTTNTAAASLSDRLIAAIEGECDGLAITAEQASNILAYLQYGAPLDDVRRDAERYRKLRDADINAVHKGGLFAGLTPDNVVINGEDLDIAVDLLIDGASPQADAARCSCCGYLVTDSEHRGCLRAATPQADAAPSDLAAPRFSVTYCSQCGQEFGPGNSGFSHCRNHQSGAFGVSQRQRDSQADADFKNFHRLLCERFDYAHDERDWKRDQLSLIEHIASRTATAAGVAQEAVGSEPKAETATLILRGELVNVGIDESGIGDMELIVGARGVLLSGLSADETKALAPLLFRQVTLAVASSGEQEV